MKKKHKMPKVVRKYYHNGVEYKIKFPGPQFPYYTTTANTILYCPLNEDITDKTGTFTMTDSGATIQNFNGVDCAKFSNSYIQTSTNYQKWQTITVSLEVYVETNGSFIGQWGTNGPRSWFIYPDITYSSYGSTAYNKQYSLSSGWNTITAVLHYSGSNPTVYINGVSSGSNGSFSGIKSSGNVPIYIGFDGNSSPAFKGYISNVIIENGDWGATKASERHNTVKHYYGIS